MVCYTTFVTTTVVSPMPGIALWNSLFEMRLKSCKPDQTLKDYSVGTREKCSASDKKIKNERCSVTRAAWIHSLALCIAEAIGRYLG